jgi:hypothetical protein
VQQGAAVILVTHQRQFMPNVDRIVLMDGGDVKLRKHRQSILKVNNEKIKLNNKLKEEYGLHDDLCNKIHDFGIETVNDLRDPHLLNKETLSTELGFNDAQVEQFLSAVENDKRNENQNQKSGGDKSSKMTSNIRLPDNVVLSENIQLNVLNDSHNPLSLFMHDDEDGDDSDFTINSHDKFAIEIESFDEEGLTLIDKEGRHSLIIHDNDDHNTTCGRIVAQGNFNQLIGVGYVQHENLHHARDREGEIDPEEALKAKIEEEANAMIEKILKEKKLLDEEEIDLTGTEMDKNAAPPPITTTTTTSLAIAKSKSPSAFTQLVGAEDREVGVVSMQTWIAYVRASGTFLSFLVCLLFIAGQVC